MKCDLRRLAIGLDVPFAGHGDEVAIAVAAGNVADGHGRQHASPLEPLAPALDGAFRLELLQKSFKADLVGALQTEGAGDLALADLGGRGGAILGRAFAGNKGEDGVARGQRDGAFWVDCLFGHEGNVGANGFARHRENARPRRKTENPT